ncbi:MAG TPA: hypothetical protein VFQ78_14685 [Candidatus Udaeobacter sp.]|jgi:hypothetical protein|nr:hypothetical protein [Candidatus Udaeobacter sp.]
MPQDGGPVLLIDELAFVGKTGGKNQSKTADEETLVATYPGD